jgi:hypothetical protein
VSALEVLGQHVDDEFRIELDRKNSLETRALGIVSANLAIVTLYFVLVTTQLLSVQVKGGTSRTLTWIALISAIVSLVTALISAVPASYPTTELPAFTDALSDVKLGMPENELREEIIEARIAQLAAASKLNAWKAGIAILSFAALVAAVALFVIALVLGIK